MGGVRQRALRATREGLEGRNVASRTARLQKRVARASDRQDGGRAYAVSAAEQERERERERSEGEREGDR